MRRATIIGAILGAIAIASATTAIVPRAREAVPPPGPWSVRFTDIAASAGLTIPSTYGDPLRKRFIVEANGCGVRRAGMRHVAKAAGSSRSVL